MRTLNRPMFRYGGPIKEGVMNGIREPKRNGGSMTQRVQPSNDGSRPGYAGPLIPIGMGIAAGARAIAPALVRYGKPLLQGAKRIFGKTTPASVTKGSKLTAAQAAKEFGKGSGRATGVTMNPSKFDPNYFGRDPIISGTGKVLQGIFSPTSKGIVAKAARFATSPSSIIAGTAYYLWPDGKERTTPPPKGAQGGKKPGENSDMYYKAPEKELTEAEKAKIESDNRIKQMDKYREIMDIKGMSKDAAYKSLIDAGKIIQEGGNLKEQLKSGKLIQNITQAASKRFDKVGDTEAALRSLIVKGEIDKEMNKDKNALDREYKKSAIDINKKKLKGSSTSEVIQSRMLKGEYPTGSELAALVRINNPQINAKVLPSGGMEQGQDPLEYITQSVAAVNADETTPDYPEGVYIIKDRIIQVVEGQVIPIPLSSLN